MIDFEYASAHLRGVWRMAAGDEDWRSDMDLSLNGVFKSFWALALSIPFAMLSFLAVARAVAAAPEDYRETIFLKAPSSVLMGAELVAMAASWAAVVAALLAGARSLGGSKQVAGLIISYNWSQLFSGIVASAPAMVFVLTGDANLLRSLALPVLVFGVYLFWAVLRRNLTIGAGVAAAFVIGVIAIELGVNSLLTNFIIAAYDALS